MGKLTRFGIALDEEILKRFDTHIKREKYTNRSEAIRDLIRAEFVRSDWGDEDKEVVCVLTLVYDHHKRGLVNRLLQIQHDQPSRILCSQHVHLGHECCLEVIIAKGKANHLKAFASQIKAQKGVMFSSISSATTGKDLL